MLRNLSLAVLILCVPAGAAAATFITDVRCADFVPHISEGIGPVSSSCSVTDYPAELWGPSANPFSPTGTAHADSFASASAAPSGLGLSAIFLLSVAGAKSGDRGASTQTYAAWNFDDFVISGPGATPVMSSLNLFMSGEMGGSVSTDGQGSLTTFVNGGGDVFIDIKLNGAFAGNGEAFSNNANGTIQAGAVDLLEGHGGADGSIHDIITSDDLLLPVGQLFSVEVELFAAAQGGVRIIGTPADEFDSVTVSGGGISSFSNTVTFPASGPVFNLPSGYTVNSVSAGIVNNQWIQIPEPSTSVLLLAASVGALMWLGLRSHSHAMSLAKSSQN